MKNSFYMDIFTVCVDCRANDFNLNHKNIMNIAHCALSTTITATKMIAEKKH